MSSENCKIVLLIVLLMMGDIWKIEKSDNKIAKLKTSYPFYKFFRKYKHI